MRTSEPGQKNVADFFPFLRAVFQILKYDDCFYLKEASTGSPLKYSELFVLGVKGSLEMLKSMK